RVPHDREHHEVVELDQVVERVLAERERGEREQPDQAGEPGGERAREHGPALDAGAGRSLEHLLAHAVAPRGSRIRPACAIARKTSTARKTTCPPSAKYCTSILAPTVCATPRTMPPTSVPHSDPTPPITTASNA